MTQFSKFCSYTLATLLLVATLTL